MTHAIIRLQQFANRRCSHPPCPVATLRPVHVPCTIPPGHHAIRMDRLLVHWGGGASGWRSRCRMGDAGLRRGGANGLYVVAVS